MLNIHPSLLPAYPGLHTHRRALADGVTTHGCTVHFVTPDVDVGPIVAQAAVPRFPDDDDATLAARVLAAEHRLLPEVVGWYLRRTPRASTAGRVRIARHDRTPQWRARTAARRRRSSYDVRRSHRHRHAASSALAAPRRRARGARTRRVLRSRSRCRCSCTPCGRCGRWSSRRTPEETVLTATLTEMPPPPVPRAEPAPTRSSAAQASRSTPRASADHRGAGSRSSRGRRNAARRRRAAGIRGSRRCADAADRRCCECRGQYR